MKHQIGLRCYGVYQFENYPYWNVLIQDFGENKYGEWLEGYAFDKQGNFQTAVTLRLPMKYKEVGYIYGPSKNFKLRMDRVKNERGDWRK